MANQIVYPLLNPVRMVPVSDPQYRQLDNDWYRNLVRSYQKPDNYAQKWLPGALVKMQFHANYGPVQIDLIRCDGSVITNVVPQAVETGLYDTGFVTYEAVFAPPSEAGYWYVLLKVGELGEAPEFETLEQLISEPQQSLSATAKNILTIDYKNDFNDQDIVFATGIIFTFCVEAVIGPLTPKSEKTLWEDQPLDLEVIEARPFRVFRFILGDAYGVPDWVADKMNRIFCCTNVILDGVQYTQVDGSEWEPQQADYIARQGWRTDIRQTKNRTSIVSENDNSPAESFAIVYNIDTRAFGTFNGNVSSNVLQITKVE